MRDYSNEQWYQQCMKGIDLKLLETLGYYDSSWHNDICASVINDKENRQIFIAEATPSDREVPEMIRFAVMPLDSDGCVTDSGPLFETESFNDLIAYLKGE